MTKPLSTFSDFPLPASRRSSTSASFFSAVDAQSLPERGPLSTGGVKLPAMTTFEKPRACFRKLSEITKNIRAPDCASRKPLRRKEVRDHSYYCCAFTIWCSGRSVADAYVFDTCHNISCYWARNRLTRLFSVFLPSPLSERAELEGPREVALCPYCTNYEQVQHHCAKQTAKSWAALKR